MIHTLGMNRKAPTSQYSWVLELRKSPSISDDDEWSQQQDEEYNGNYTFIVIEDSKKKCKHVANIQPNLQMDTNYEDE